MNIKLYNNYNIIIVGVGGTGSHLISYLSQLIGNNTRLMEHAMTTLMDGDLVEEKNLRNQKFLKSDVNKYKAEVLANRYSSVFGINILHYDRYIENESQIVERLKCDKILNIIISCVDNNKARRIIDSVFNKYEYNIVYIDAGNSSGQSELTGQIVVGLRFCDKIILPSVSKYFPQILDESQDDTETLSCGEQMTKNIQNIGANMNSAINIFNVMNSLLCSSEINTNFTVFNATTMQTNNIVSA